MRRSRSLDKCLGRCTEADTHIQALPRRLRVNVQLTDENGSTCKDSEKRVHPNECRCECVALYVCVYRTVFRNFRQHTYGVSHSVVWFYSIFFFLLSFDSVRMLESSVSLPLRARFKLPTQLKRKQRTNKNTMKDFRKKNRSTHTHPQRQ